MRILSQLLVCLFLFSSSCKKNDNTGYGKRVAAGIVIDATDGKPVTNAITYLTRAKYGSPGAWGIKTLETKVTGPDGKFYYIFDMEEGYDYTVYGEAKYYVKDSRGAWIKPDESSNDLVVSLSPLGYIHTILKHDSTKIPVMTMVISAGRTTQSYALNGFNGDTSFIFEADGNAKNGVAIDRNYGQGYRATYNEVYCPKFDTTDYIVHY